MPEIVVVGSLKARPGKEADTAEALAALVAPTHAEDGYILYALNQGIADPTRFAFIERWESQEHLNAHFGTEHIAAALARVDELLSEPPEIVVYNALPAASPPRAPSRSTPAADLPLTSTEVGACVGPPPSCFVSRCFSKREGELLWAC